MNGVLAGKTVTRISTNGSTCVVLCSDGTVASWGRYSSGPGYSNVPVLLDSSGVLAGKSVIGIGQGDGPGFTISDDGSAAGWGNNAFGGIGDGTMDYRNEPVALEVSGELYKKKVLSISGGGAHMHTVIAEPASGYIAWMAGRTGVRDKTETADSDLDGIPNLLEYVLNGDPAPSATEILPKVSANGADFIFEFNRLPSSEEDTIQVFRTALIWSSGLT